MIPYEQPIVEIINLATEDVLTASGDKQNDLAWQKMSWNGNSWEVME